MRRGGHHSERVPFVDLERQHRDLREELRQALDRITRGGDFVLGEEGERFEREFADYVGARFAVGVASGTAALTIGLRAAGIGRGDEVIVPAHTYIASALGVVHAGATPLFCDVQDRTGLIDLDAAGPLVSERTAAVMAVHLYGQACEMDTIRSFADRHGLAVIEDAAQAHGAAWKDVRVGSFGLFSAFSFYPSKNLGALGDGGIICTNDHAIAEGARWLRNLGQRSKGEHLIAGYNERLDTLQAAFLRVKLRRLDDWNRRRGLAAALYREHLPAAAQPVAERAGARDINHLFPVRVRARDRVAAEMGRAGIETGIHYSPPVHLQLPFKGLFRTQLPAAEGWAEEELSLPIFAHIRGSEVERVCQELERATTVPAPATPVGSEGV